MVLEFNRFKPSAGISCSAGGGMFRVGAALGAALPCRDHTAFGPAAATGDRAGGAAWGTLPALGHHGE